MWIDPATEASPAIDPTDPGFNNAITQYAFRQGSPATGGTTQSIDNLVVGTAFGDVVPVPEPASLSMIALAAAPLVGRRRATR
jgi:hypothetical protein